MATTPVRPLAWEPPYAAGVALKSQKKKKKKKREREREKTSGLGTCSRLPITTFLPLPGSPLLPSDATFSNFFLRATPGAYGSSRAKDPIGAAPASLQGSHGNTRSLTHRVRPGIQPTSSWILVRFVSTARQQEPSCYRILTSVRPHVKGKQGPKSPTELPPRQGCLSPFLSDFCLDTPATREKNERWGQAGHQQRPFTCFCRDQSYVPSVPRREEASQRFGLLRGTSTKA